MESRGQTSSIDQMAQRKLAALENQSLRRALAETERKSVGRARRDRQELISFCCNDYLGLSQHPDVKRAAAQAIEELGVGAGASRLVTGNHPLYRDLENQLARLKGTEAALVFGSGYLANLGIPPVLAGKNDLIIADDLSHASMRAGIQASTAESRFFAHNDVEDCRTILENERNRFDHCLIMTEGVFSMDGDRAPLVELCDLADAHDAWIMTDDAHGLGVLGGGRGSAVEAGVADRIPLQMGTLSKAVGAYGGFICASRAVIDLLVNRARSLIYATGLPPSAVASSCAALDIISSNEALVGLPLARASQFTRELNLPGPESSIVPIIVGDAETALSASKQLAQEGFLVTAIRPPTVPDKTARLRFTFAATHSEDDVFRLTAAVKKIGLLP
ncbi:MAG: 8-amino-7-oxononanoate synthase [Rhodospirillaceae bacterium]|nr:8-amino-7-oxononanoate synthase [Rhodospirillaceae bacterium]